MNLREGAEAVAARIREAGYEAYFAGGCVRDLSLGKIPKDYDIATNALPKVVLKLFKRTVEVGAAFGVVRVTKGKGLHYEVATYRNDGEYSDGRRPDQVQYSTDKQEDVLRRDFTINALLMDPATEEVLDYVGGRADLTAGLIRAVGTAEQRFAEDRLRMLRAIRFAARFGFQIETSTFSAMRAHADAIKDVSVERIIIEIKGMILAQEPGLAFSLLKDSGLFAALFPWVEPASMDSLQYFFKGLAELELGAEAKQHLAFAAIFGGLDDQLAEEKMRAFKLSREEMRVVLELLKARPVLCSPELRGLSRLRLAAGKKLVLMRNYQRLLQPEAQEVAHFEGLVRAFAEQPLPSRPILNGQDLKNHGFKPGPKFKELLQEADDLVLQRKLSTREEALAWLAEQS